MWLIIFIVLPFKYVQTPNRSKHEIQNPFHKMLHLKEIYKLHKIYVSIINIPRWKPSCLSHHECNASCYWRLACLSFQELSNDHTLPPLSLFRNSGQSSNFQFNCEVPWHFVVLNTQSMHFTLFWSYQPVIPKVVLPMPMPFIYIYLLFLVFYWYK